MNHRFNLSDRIVWIIVACLGAVPAWAGTVEAGDPASAPAAQPSGDTRSLRDERNLIVDRVLRLEIELAEFKLQHPEVPTMSEVVGQRLARISEALVSAQLRSIDARACYAAKHPALRQALARERELFEMYEAAHRQVIDTNRLAAQHAKLTAELAQQREYLRRLDERLGARAFAG